MSDPKTTELFDTLAKVLLRCGVSGYHVQIGVVDYEFQRGGKTTGMQAALAPKMWTEGPLVSLRQNGEEKPVISWLEWAFC